LIYPIGQGSFSDGMPLAKTLIFGTEQITAPDGRHVIITAV
jgi:hypothetical protein